MSEENKACGVRGLSPCSSTGGGLDLRLDLMSTTEREEYSWTEVSMKPTVSPQIFGCVTETV